MITINNYWYEAEPFQFVCLFLFSDISITAKLMPNCFFLFFIRNISWVEKQCALIFTTRVFWHYFFLLLLFSCKASSKFMYCTTRLNNFFFFREISFLLYEVQYVLLYSHLFVGQKGCVIFNGIFFAWFDLFHGWFQWRLKGYILKY